jgi:valyl-tRNA synthetase
MTRDKSSESPGIVYSALKQAYIETLKMFSTICPLLTEYLWQELKKASIVKEESIHLCSWPEYDEKLIDESLEEEFEYTMKIIEAGLFARDKAQIGLKWPLAKAEIVCDSSISKEIQGIIATQLNVKKITIKKGKELKVELDTKLTSELESEGYAREISRKVQALRKTAGLVKENLIDLILVLDENLKKLVEPQKEMIKERTNSKKIEITTKTPSNKFQAESKDKIKEKEISIYFNKI